MIESQSERIIHQSIDLAVLLTLFILISAYAIHVWSISTHILNIVMVIPVSIFALLLCTIEFFTKAKVESRKDKESFSSVLPAMLIFSVYVLSLEWLGLDVGTVIFVALFLWLHGERRWYWAVSYGVVFGMTAALLFSELLPYPLPMSILETEY